MSSARVADVVSYWVSGLQEKRSCPDYELEGTHTC